MCSGGQVHAQIKATALRVERQRAVPARGHNVIVILVILVAFDGLWKRIKFVSISVSLKTYAIQTHYHKSTKYRGLQTERQCLGI
jgi:hypothetical protein